MKKFTVFLCLAIVATGLMAQTLQRRGALGVYLKNSEDGVGVSIQEVFEGSTASALGLEAGDVLLKVDGKAYNGLEEFIPFVRGWRVGREITVTVLRGDKEIDMTAGIVGKPLETSEHAEVIYGAVPYDGGQLRSIMEVPKGVSKPPVLFFLPGIGCASWDYYYDNTVPMKQLVEGLVKRGYAVYRVEKPGMGDSEGTQDCMEMGYHYEVNAFKAALKQLKSNPQIDADNIFLYGHSLGVLTAPQLAAESPVKGIIAWGGVTTSWYEYLLRMLRDQNEIQGYDYEWIEQKYRNEMPFLYDFLVKQMTPEEMAKNPAYKKMVEEKFVEGKYWLNIQHYKYVQEINQVDLTAAWKNSACPVIALHGEYDLHAIDSQWAEHVTKLMNYYYPGAATWAIVPKTTHHMYTTASWAEYMELREKDALDKKYMSKHFNPQIIDMVADWVGKVLDGSVQKAPDKTETDEG